MFYYLSIIIGANHRYKNHQSGFHIIGKVTKRKRSLQAVNQNCVCWTGAGVGVGLWHSLLGWDWRLEDLFTFKLCLHNILLNIEKNGVYAICPVGEWREWLPMGMMRILKPVQVTPPCYHFSFL